ncbi:MAG TPA: hypothetical protein VK666_17825 [Chryseolinea sp.]|nr:hypothetical protein [Chryseolinea sp.]
MKSFKTYALIAASICFIIVIGGAVYEHLTMVPHWKLAPPNSLTMFQGEYGINSGRFWQLIHPVTLILLITSLTANWKTERRKYIAIPLTGYVIILIITFSYFVPELLSIIQTPYQASVDVNLVARAGLWEKLSLARLAVLVGLASMVLMGLTRGNEKSVQ